MTPYVEVADNDIIITMPATAFRVVYRQAPDAPGLPFFIGDDFQLSVPPLASDHSNLP
jgi:hypothetical protein